MTGYRIAGDPGPKLGRSVAALALALALLLGACSAVAVETPDPLAGLDADTRDAIATRERLGLRADLAWVRQVAADPNADTQTIDIPLTPKEAADLQRRFDLSSDAAQIANAYAAEHRDTFAGLYIDQPSGGRVVVLFTEDVEGHQAALDALWGDPGFIVVEAAQFTESILRRIQKKIGEADLAAQGIALISTSAGYLGDNGFENNVQVVAKSDNPRARAILEAFGPPGAVTVQLFPADRPWSNPAGGPGWRFVGSFRTELPYTVGVATTPAELASELKRYGIPGGMPDWDQAKEVIAIFSEGIGSSCPEVRLDGVTFDLDQRLVYATMSDPLSPRGCTADLVGAETFVVALSRASLPPSPFTLRLHEELIGCHPDCGSGPTEVLVTLD